ncbi:MAG: YfhO family protein [bacterium]|nr:YfhO family protein [bacterium]
MNKIKSFINKYKFEIFITIIFACFYIFLTRFGKYYYGSTLDWNVQHYLIPDYFRKLFYKTGNLIPSFAFNIGSGQNIYNLSYYGLLSPTILISYLLPFISMKSYIQISSILLIYISVLLFKYFISSKFDKKITIISTILYMLSGCLLFHSHRHIMFVNYMPFLIMGLIGVDNYFNNNRKSLLTLSIILITSTSYFFSISSILCIILYGIYVYIKTNKTIKFNQFFTDGFKFLMPIFIGILASMIILLPTFIALLNGRADTSVVIDYLKLFIPTINTGYILYNSYSPGLTSFVYFALIYSIVEKKKENRFLAICLSILLIFPIFIYLLNGGMYINAKVLIPFTPLFIFVIAITMNSMFKSKKSNLIPIFLFIILGIYVFLSKDNSFYLNIDFVITMSCLIIFSIIKKDYYIYVPLIIIMMCMFAVSNYLDKLQSKKIDYNNNSTKQLVDYIQNIDNSIYRISNRNGGLATANYIVNSDYNTSSYYSSIGNQNYQYFYYQGIGNDILNRSRGQLSAPKNLIFNIYSGNKYLIGPEINELGYDFVKSIDNNYLYINNDVLPIGYVSNRVMPISYYNKLEYPYNVEAILNYVIIDDNSAVEYNSNIKKIDFDYEIVFKKDLTIDKKDNVVKIDSEQNGELVIDLGKKLENEILFIKFNLLDSNSCGVGDNLININGISNKLTCKNWKYYNNNKTFEYTISEEKLNRLTIKFDKGNYKISDIETYIINYSDLVNGYNDIDTFNISNISGDVIEGSINNSSNGYFNLSIPYDNGFNIYVDNKKIKYEKTDLSFIGFKMEEGYHDIKIEYKSPGLTVAKTLSLIGFSLFAFNVYVESPNYKCKKTKDT